MVNKYYPHLFEKGHIGKLELKNRIVRNSMGTYLAEGNMYVGDRTIKAGAEAAQGGIGLVFMDNCTVNHMYHMGLCAADDTYIPGLSKLAVAIKDNGAAAGMQLAHPGRDTGIVGGDHIVAASAVLPDMMYELMGAQLPEEMSINEIHELVEQYGDAARRVKQAGFDIVEIHAAAGCLPTNFLSPHDNQRRDIYGGCLHNRMRFLLEIIANIRKKTGPDYPISVKLSMDDYEPDSIKLEETIEVCKGLEAAGVNFLNLVCGTHVTGWISTGFFPLAFAADMAAAVKKEVHIPVLVTGNIQTPELGEQILAEGKADFIGSARGQLADPFWAKKAKCGHAEDITPCIRCMVGCADRGMMNNTTVQCAVNPSLFKYYGKEKYEPTDEPKKVAVIGAGPAGVEAAVTAKKRGHDVTLFEKREVGGTLIEASVPPYKADLRRLIAYYKNLLKKNEINIVNEEATLETIKEGGYDAVVIAVGAAARKLNVPGIDNEIVCYALDYLGGKVKYDGNKAVVIGGGITGAEAALELAAEGKQVTIVEVMDKFLGTPGAVVPCYINAVMQAGIRVITGNRLESVEDHKAIIVDRFGNHEEIETDAIVIAAGFVPQKELAEAIEAETEAEVYLAGDCKGARQIYDATQEGYAAGRQI